MKYRLIKENIYKEGSGPWLCFIDCCCSEVDGIVTINDMMRDHAQPINFYERHIPTLIRDGLIEEIT